MTKVMATSPKIKTSLAFITGQDKLRYLVLTRDYGAVIALVLDDSNMTENTVFRVQAKIAQEFLTPYSDDVVSPELAEQYDQLQLYLCKHNLALLGPLTSARAALAIKIDNLSPKEAIKVAIKTGRILADRQFERIQIVKAALSK